MRQNKQCNHDSTNATAENDLHSRFAEYNMGPNQASLVFLSCLDQFGQLVWRIIQLVWPIILVTTAFSSWISCLVDFFVASLAWALAHVGIPPALAQP